jgi:hypothetical protein
MTKRPDAKPAQPKADGTKAAKPAGAPISGFSVQALSRGRGVPAEAREALQKVRALVEADRAQGMAVTLESRRFGLEGETELCIEYEDREQAAATFRRAQALVSGVDLVTSLGTRVASARRARIDE